MRVWSWAAAGAILLVTAVSCLSRAPSHRANAQPTAAAPAQPAAPADENAAATAPAAADETGGDKKTEEVLLEHADRVRYDNKTKEYTLTGDVVLRHEDGVLRAQTVRMNSDTKKGVATGDLSFADEETTLTAERLEIDFDARIGLFKGDVRLVTQKKPEAEEGPAAAGGEQEQAPAPGAESEGETAGAGEDEEAKPFSEYWEERTEIRCPELEYSYREDRAVARGGITARQKDRTGRADEAVYTDQDEMLVLSGSVEMKNERGETLRADKMTISIKDEWLEAEGAADSRFLIEEEEQGEAAPGEVAPEGAVESEQAPQ
ncbi:MAG: hypothetical protein JSV65_09240 [Armatimonadota bacterium]|nr:MAG: hypothetical protein JSV65_09240 [Armatimonadota bacterium]